MSTHAPRPPAVPGFPEPRGRDVVRMVWWAGQGFAYSTTRGTLWARCTAVLLVLGWVVMLPLMLVAQWALVHRRSARYYLSADRDAVLALVATDGAWGVGDHGCARIGTGQGRRLREALMPSLLPAADAAGVGLTLTAASPALADLYAAEVPGLVPVGRHFPRGVKMRREPSALTRGQREH